MSTKGRLISKPRRLMHVVRVQPLSNGIDSSIHEAEIWVVDVIFPSIVYSSRCLGRPVSKSSKESTHSLGKNHCYNSLPLSNRRRIWAGRRGSRGRRVGFSNGLRSGVRSGPRQSGDPPSRSTCGRALRLLPADATRLFSGRKKKKKRRRRLSTAIVGLLFLLSVW